MLKKKNEHSTSKVNVHDLLYATQSASCLHGSHAVDVVARRRRGISWYLSHGMRSKLQWSYCKPGVRLHGVTGGPATSRTRAVGLEVCCPVYGHTVQRGWGIQYSTESRQQGVHWSWVINALYAWWTFWWHVQSTLHLMVCIYGRAVPAVLIICIRLIFGCTIRPNTNSVFSHDSVPNRIQIEYSVQP